MRWDREQSRLKNSSLYLLAVIVVAVIEPSTPVSVPVAPLSFPPLRVAVTVIEYSVPSSRPVRVYDVRLAEISLLESEKQSVLGL